MSLIQRNCAWCGKEFTAKSADVKRGWARTCCKSHAAKLREKKLDRTKKQPTKQYVEPMVAISNIPEERFNIDNDGQNWDIKDHIFN